MTKEITKANILAEIEDKFSLRELEPERFTFLESVRPVYNIEAHLVRPTVQYQRVSITSATGFTFFSVPLDERWTIDRYTVTFLGVGAIKICGVYVTRSADSHVHHLYLDLTKNQTVSYQKELSNPVQLNSLDSVKICCDDYTSTQNLDLTIDCRVETVR